MTSGPLEATILYTDQTQCYDELGHVIPCTGSGQDGEYSDCPRTASERFQLEGSLVLDSVTGFRWCRDANPAGFPLSWEEAHALIREMNRTGALGRADWALPSRQQLFTLVSHETTRPALPIGHPFVNVFGGWY